MSSFPGAIAPAPSAGPASSPARAAGARKGFERRPRARLLRWAMIALAALTAAVVALRSFRPQAAMPEGLLVVNGRLEGDSVNVSGRETGRVARLLVREGDSVTMGQELVHFDDAALRTREAQGRAAVDVAERRAAAARVDLEVARRQVALDVQTARAALTAADATLDKAIVAEQQAGRDDERASMLLREGVVQRQQAEQAVLAHQLARAEHAVAAAARESALRGLDQAALGNEHLRARTAELRVLEAAAAQAAAQLAEVRTALDELIVKSPISGTITQRFVNVGEVVGAGAALYQLVDLDALYLRAYVPEPMMGRVPLGAAARIYTDAAPEEPVPAELRYVSSRAEFTPKEVQTPDERVKLVYAVKLYLIANPEHRLMPGLSADAVIRYREDTPWAPPRW
jgi:HlyD family secretion protein